MSKPAILVTGASGQLGRLVLSALKARDPDADIVALVRRAETAEEIAAAGAAVRIGDYSDPDSLRTAMAGIDRVLLISSNEMGQRVAQHQNVIDAAAGAGVGFIAYTSLLHADTSPLGLAEEHRKTESALAASGMAWALLRNGWYTENYSGAIALALQHGVLVGSAGDGRISSAARADYADAAAEIMLAAEPETGAVYELAGDEAFTLSDLAVELSRQSGKTIPYRDLPAADYEKALAEAGLPPFLADFLAECDVGTSKGALYDDGHRLSRLIGRPTTPWQNSMESALAAVPG